MHTGETLAAAPPARPLRQSRLGGLSLFLALAGVAIALAVMALALGERIDLSDENHLLGLFAALLAVFAVSTCGLVLGLAGLLRRSRKRHLALAGIVLNLSCLLWGWHALSTAAAAILMVLGQTGLSFLSARGSAARSSDCRIAAIRRGFAGGGAQPGKEGARGAKGEPRRCGSPGLVRHGGAGTGSRSALEGIVQRWMDSIALCISHESFS
ncbi:hypothetical protein [Pseudomonas aeruginosa]